MPLYQRRLGLPRLRPAPRALVTAMTRWLARHDILIAALAGVALGAGLAWPNVAGSIWLAFLLGWLASWFPRLYQHR